MLTSCSENRQGVGDLLVHLVTGQIATVKLMKNFPILDEEDSLCRARCFDTMRYHDNRLPVIVDRIKESQKLIRRSGIKRTARFIGKDQLRLCDQSTYNGCSAIGAIRLSISVYFFPDRTSGRKILSFRVSVSKRLKS